MSKFLIRIHDKQREACESAFWNLLSG